MEQEKQHEFNDEMQGFDRFAHRWLCRWFSYRDIVKRVDGKRTLYLRRFYLWHPGEGMGGWFIHNIRRPDNDRYPHSHPWRFKTWCILGGYVEHVVHDVLAEGALIGYLRYFYPGQTLDNPAIHTHMITKLFRESTWTLVRAYPAERDWDFLTPEGRVQWEDYLRKNDPDALDNGASYAEDVVLKKSETK